ncbi:MAG: hypothetical protein K6G42_10390 [Lachnospiraceae bacterium]|nr:hypothetical protein [Lachnospiraceae bacterium]
MSYKQTLKNTLEMLLHSYEKEIASTESIYSDPELNEKGIASRIAQNKERFQNHWSQITKDINEMATTISETATAAENKALSEKVGNIEYSSLLASTLSTLPYMAEADKEVLKQRLSVFNDDPIAISAIKQALPGKGLEWNSVLPIDTRGSKQETVSKITKTVLTHISNVYDELGNRKARHTMIPAGIQSTLAYISTLNNDCTACAEAADE